MPVSPHRLNLACQGRLLQLKACGTGEGHFIPAAEACCNEHRTMAGTPAFREVQRHHAASSAPARAVQRAPVHVASKEVMVVSVGYEGMLLSVTGVGVLPVAVAVIVTLLAAFWPLSAMLFQVGGHTSMAVSSTCREGCPKAFAIACT